MKNFIKDVIRGWPIGLSVIVFMTLFGIFSSNGQWIPPTLLVAVVLSALAGQERE